MKFQKGHIMTPEMRARISKKLTGFKRPPETNRLIISTNQHFNSTVMPELVELDEKYKAEQEFNLDYVKNIFN